LLSHSTCFHILNYLYRYNEALRFHPPGSVACGALDVSQLVEIPMSPHPTVGLCRLNQVDPCPITYSLSNP
jgi:hypothetical protein